MSEAPFALRPRRLWNGIRTWFPSLLRVPMYREAYALVLSGGISSVLGLAFWTAAARSYDPDVVGLNSAVISAMMFLAGVSQLNLANAAVRFLPAAGLAAMRFAITIYLLSLASAVVATTAFLAGVGIWTPSLSFLRDTPGFAAAFTVSAMAWAAFNLQHSLLIGLRRAIWVPVENGAYSAGKLALVLILANAWPYWGIFASWTIALALTVLPTVTLILGRMIPRHVVLTGPRVVPPNWSNVSRYVAGDYLGGLCWLASTTLVPLIVLEQSGAAANAYFSLSWVIVLPLYTVGASMGSSLVVSAVFDAGELKTLAYRMLRQTALLVVPLAIALFIAAPYILRVFGESYSSHGTWTLRLLALATIPGMLTTMCVNVARVQRRMSMVTLVFAAQSALVLGLSWISVKPYGLIGAGLAWLVGQSVVAAVVAVYVILKLRSGRLTGASDAQNAPPPRSRVL